MCQYADWGIVLVWHATHLLVRPIVLSDTNKVQVFFIQDLILLLTLLAPPLLALTSAFSACFALLLVFFVLICYEACCNLDDPDIR